LKVRNNVLLSNWVGRAFQIETKKGYFILWHYGKEKTTFHYFEHFDDLVKHMEQFGKSNINNYKQRLEHEINNPYINSQKQK